MSGCLAGYSKSVARGKDFRVQAVARERRELAIGRAEEAVRAQRGDLLDFATFGGLSLNLIVEMSGDGVLALADSLAALGWSVDVDPGRDALAPRAGEPLESTFQVTFPEGDGEPAIPSPAVPGCGWRTCSRGHAFGDRTFNPQSRSDNLPYGN